MTGAVNLALAASHASHRIISGELAPDRAIATAVVEVPHGPGAFLERFTSTFHLAA